MSETRIVVGQEVSNVYISADTTNLVEVTDSSQNLVVVSQELQNVINVVTRGMQGPAGTQIIDGEGAPSNSIGRIGDYFFDRPNGRLYGPKTALGWGNTYIQLAAYLALNDLTDVQSAGAADQDVLMYRDATDTWVNQRIRYRHEQPVPSDEWTVNHGLNTKPAAVSVFDTSQEMVFGEVDHVNESQLILRFSAAFAGVAYLT